MEMSRRKALKLFGATAAGVAAASTVTLNEAEAATKFTKVGTIQTPVDNPLGWKKSVKRKVVGATPTRYETVKLPVIKNLLTTNRPTKANLKLLLKKGLWYYSFSAAAGSNGHLVIFGHRTSDGGPMKYSHYLRGEQEDLVATFKPSRLELPADRIVVNGFEYIVEQVKVWPIYTAKNQTLAERQLAQDSLDGIFTYPQHLPGAAGGRLSIVACSKPTGMFTGTKHRIVVRARLNGPAVV